ncbi:MAG: hypothetical protein QXD13_00090, partial [Candidatus Pacearchaeota archaeon]
NSSNLLTQYYIDNNYAICCAVTGLVSDCSIDNNSSYANQTLACQYNATEPPTITSYLVEPLDPYFGGNVSISASASDDDGVSGIFANITLPNGNIVIISLDANYTIGLAGRHNVTIWANDTSGNIASISGGYFIAGTEQINVTFNVVDSNLTGIQANLTVYFAGTNDKVDANSFIGTHYDSHTNILYDLFYKAFNDYIYLRLNNVNLSLDYNNTLGLDRIANYLGYLAVYEINNTYGISNAVLNISYAGTGYGDENYLIVYKCANWDFVLSNCNGAWEDATSSTIQDKTNDRFGIIVSGFSAYAIKQESAPTPTPTPSGGGAGRVVLNYSLSEELIEIKMLEGEFAVKEFEAINTGTGSLSVEFSLEGFEGLQASLDNNIVSISRGESKQVKISVNSAGAVPGVYTGRIIASARGVGMKIINVIVEVKEKGALFDASLSIIKKDSVIAGANLSYELTLRNIAQKEVNVEIEFFVADLNKNILSRVSGDSFKMLANQPVWIVLGTFEIPESLAAGDYMLLAKIKYNGAQAETYDLFKVSAREKCGIVCWLIAVILLIELLILVVVFYRKKWRKAISKIMEKEQEVKEKIREGISAIKEGVIALNKGIVNDLESIVFDLENVLKNAERKFEKTVKRISEAEKRVKEGIKTGILNVGRETKALGIWLERKAKKEATNIKEKTVETGEKIAEIQAMAERKIKKRAKDLREIANNIGEETTKEIAKGINLLRGVISKIGIRAAYDLEELKKDSEKKIKQLGERLDNMKEKAKRKGEKAVKEAREEAEKAERETFEKIKTKITGAKESARFLGEAVFDGAEIAVHDLEKAVEKVRKRAKEDLSRIQKETRIAGKEIKEEAKLGISEAKRNIFALGKGIAKDSEETLELIERRIADAKKRIKKAREKAKETEKIIEERAKEKLSEAKEKSAELKEKIVQEIEKAVKEKPVVAKTSEPISEEEIYELSARKHELFEKLKNMTKDYEKGLIDERGYKETKKKMIEEIKALKKIIDKKKRVKRFVGRVE